MPLLALDTSAAISVAVLDDADTPGRLLASSFAEQTRLHAEQLAPMVRDLLDSAGLTAPDLTAIAVGTGPGPYTGLRIGLATAAALAFALDIPLYGVNSLDALAAGAATELELGPGAEIVATLDARRREIYWAHYRVAELDTALDSFGVGRVVEVTPAQVNSPSIVASQFRQSELGDGHLSAETKGTGPCAPRPGGGVRIVGDGALKYGILGATEPRYVRAEWVGRLALARAADGLPQSTTPLYLRRPDIQGQAPELLASAQSIAEQSNAGR